ncbi:transketolase [Saccharopolyspora dendranthemae]|uniref:Transketolase n=1 Tax=Saccharopolyspora dendranthemae TaxID=1181886 RepID=A0A561V881_9PSEU|nr:transketolase [Saccharopolyspora dendranthemae]TWG07810.1 transketolase [Saccharopolyspora dendranthemae]
MTANDLTSGRRVSDELDRLTTARVPGDWTELDQRAVDTARVLAADAVENCGSGHPGTAMSLAPAAYALFQRVMRHDPTDPEWIGRDRFVLSAGHSSLTLYVQLFLSGYGLELNDLKQLRKWGSLTPGHPEYGHTKGVETTTGPLGQGLSTAVGMAMAARRERGLFDPEAAPGESPFDHHIYVIASDGDIEEGVTSEASSLAGVQQLGNLTVLYDANEISIEDNTGIALTEDTAKRYESYGWQVLTVHGGEDVQGLLEAIESAKAETTRPTLIVLRTVIGYPAPTKMNSGKAHGAALGGDEVAEVKKALGFDPEQSFEVSDEVLTHARDIITRGRASRGRWQIAFDAWAAAHPERKALLDRLQARELPAGWAGGLPNWEPGEKDVATRKASAEVLSSLADALPELWGGSADLAESNNTTMRGADSFGPESISTETWSANPYGRTLHFGIREHAMGAVLNGIALHGGTRPYGGTFLVFSDYMRPAVRLAALMRLPVVYVWTHDSIGLGEDGPTHQPIEHLSSLRAIPGLAIVRPADANETTAAWKTVLENPTGPAGLALTRQGVPILEGVDPEGVGRGGYVLADASSGAPEVVLIGTGSEVQLAVAARRSLEADGIPTRVVSMPCVEWFDAQDEAYRESVLPPSVRARVAVEAGLAQPWHRFVGDAGEIVSIEHFGASADHLTLYAEYGITARAVAEAATRSLKATSHT